MRPAALLCLALALGACAAPPRKHPGRWPRPLYWFWTPRTLAGERWRREAEDLARRGPCDLVFATPRYPWPEGGGIDFLDTARFRPLFTRTAALLRRGGVRLAVDLRCYPGLRRRLPPAACQELLEAVVVRLDRTGRATAPLQRDPVLFPAVARRVATRYVWTRDRRTGALLGEVQGEVRDGRLHLRSTPRLGGRTVVAFLRHRYNHPDMFSGTYERTFAQALAAYAAVPLAGAALDEFAYLPLRGDAWPRFVYYSPGAAAAYRRRYGTELLADLARVFGAYDPGARAAVVNRYNALHRDALARVERAFYRAVKRHLGAKAFVGVHPTNQTLPDFNSLELRLTFLDWWAVPRDYGQTDEATPMAVRLGLALKAGGPVWYHMFYHRDEKRIFAELARCARFGGRLHYHAYGDERFGLPLEAGDLLERLAAAEARLAVLDRHVRGVPRLDALVVLGWPYLVFWPTAPRENRYREAMTFLERLWRRGFRAAAVPSYEIAAGTLRLEEGRAVYCGRAFREVIFWQPEYATPPTQRFLRVLAGGSRTRLFVVGRLTRDFGGRPLRLDALLASHRRRPAELLARRPPPHRDDGVAYPGGLRVYVDAPSLRTGRPARRTFTWRGRSFTFAFVGALVLETKPGRPPRRLP